MQEIKWCAVPEMGKRGKPKGAKNPKYRWLPELTILQERPGEWARIFVGSDRAARQVGTSLNGRRRVMPQGEYAFLVRKLSPRQTGVWGTYLGKGK